MTETWNWSRGLRPYGLWLLAVVGGALASVLTVFQRAGVNLKHIDKRPGGRTNWQYTFFIDAEGHVDDPWFAAAIQQAKGLCRELHVLGSYPRSRRIL